jgi:hypothetical protein
LIPDEVLEFFSIYHILPAAICPWVDSVSSRNEYQEDSWGVMGSQLIWLITLLPSVSELPYKMWEPQPLTPLWVFMACYRDNFTFFFYIAATVSKQYPWWSCVRYYKKVCHETRYKCENCRVALCAAPCFECYHMVADF